MNDKNIDGLLNILGFIALFKSILPFSLRGWVTSLGLHVQQMESGGWTRIQAGGKFRSYLDAWRQNEGVWDIRKFDSVTWEHRFANLVHPTYNIAEYEITIERFRFAFHRRQWLALIRFVLGCLAQRRDSPSYQHRLSYRHMLL